MPCRSSGARSQGRCRCVVSSNVAPSGRWSCCSRSAWVVSPARRRWHCHRGRDRRSRAVRTIQTMTTPTTADRSVHPRRSPELGRETVRSTSSPIRCWSEHSRSNLDQIRGRSADPAPRCSSHLTSSAQRARSRASALLRETASSGVRFSHGGSQARTAPSCNMYAAQSSRPPWQAPQNARSTSSADGGSAMTDRSTRSSSPRLARPRAWFGRPLDQSAPRRSAARRHGRPRAGATPDHGSRACRCPRRRRAARRAPPRRRWKRPSAAASPRTDRGTARLTSAPAGRARPQWLRRSRSARASPSRHGAASATSRPCRHRRAEHWPGRSWPRATAGARRRL